MGLRRRKERRPGLALVSDEFGRAGRFSGLHVVAAPEHEPPFHVDAVAVEEDTNLLLSAPTEIREPEEDLASIIDEIHRTPPREPGNVLVRRGEPLLLLAIVHDVGLQPTWRDEWIAAAIHGVFEEAEWQRVRALAVPLLGTRHGSADPHLVTRWLGRCLSRKKLRHLRRLWLVSPPGRESELMTTLRAELSG